MASSELLLLLVLGFSSVLFTTGQASWGGLRPREERLLQDFVNPWARVENSPDGQSVGTGTGNGQGSNGTNVNVDFGTGAGNNNNGNSSNSNAGIGSAADGNGTGPAGNGGSGTGLTNTGTGNGTGSGVGSGQSPNVDGTGTGGGKETPGVGRPGKEEGTIPVNGTGTGAGSSAVDGTGAGAGSGIETGSGMGSGTGAVPGPDSGTGPAGGSGNQTENPVRYEAYKDRSGFLKGFNGWNLVGYFAKLKLLDDNQSFPQPPDSNDSSVLICLADAVECELSKEFPPLVNATLYLTHYISRGTNFLMQCIITAQSGEQVTLFSLDAQDVGETAHNWIFEDFNLPSVVGIQPFQVKFLLRGQKWAVDHIDVEGWRPLNLPDTPVTTLSPSVNTTLPVIVNPVVNTTGNATNFSNVTTAPAPTNGNVTSPPSNTTDNSSASSVVNSTASSPVANVTPSEGDEIGDQSGISDNSSMSSHISELSRVAKAIWDAFYVFLALFCVCLVALIVLIYRGRYKNENQTPAVAAYHPRNNSYRLDKLYDNPAYDQQQPPPQA
ncbi:uncharacterized protein LOC143040864 isoform X2 [Oratosquilla oratoria]|uniref:uncharacterized protein LOC143040864 isoform X2 n=1 Tax=Oratosquilla oratoria TaxID=337810 RepID=UPI003F76D695